MTSEIARETRSGERLIAGTSELRALFPSIDARAYVDTANYGLPPRRTVETLRDALVRWGSGSANWLSEWDPAGDECRTLIAPLLGSRSDEIALLPAVSVGVGVIAASLGPEDEVVVPNDEFRSVLFPLLAAERARGVRVRRVSFEELAESVRPSTTLVATSHVRSNGGAVQDLAAVAAAAREHGAAVLVDATHAAGVIPIEAEALGLDYVVVAAYKHLLCPRGVAFLRVARGRRDLVAPYCSSWRSARDPYASFYGGTLDDLAADTARFDVSLAWHAWLGARESLRLLTTIDADERRDWCVGLASRLARQVGLEPTGSSILAVPVRTQIDEARRRLAEAAIVASFPAGLVRISFHIYNTGADVDYVANVIDALVDRI